VKDLEFFKSLPNLRRQLVCEKMFTRIYSKGEIVSQQNQDCYIFLIIKKGEAKAEQIIDIQSKISYPIVRDTEF
jgi:hypothetical protein